MRKSTRRQTCWSKSVNQFKRIVLLSLVALLALSVPAISNVVNTFTKSEVSVVHAETSNLMNVNEILTQFMVNHNDTYEHWTHTLQNDGDMIVDGPDFDLTDLKYVVKFPDELSHLLEDDYVLDYLFGREMNFDYARNPFSMTGIVIDENGEEVSITMANFAPYEHISINYETNSLEFDFDSFYTTYNVDPLIRQNFDGDYVFNNVGFRTPITVPDVRMLHNGTYEFKTAIVRGDSVDLDDVANAYQINLEIDYSTDPEPEPDPEDPVDTEALEALLAEASGYNPADYTEDSFALLMDAVAEAEEVLANEDATQEEVDAALVNLEAAIAGLVAVEPDPDPEPEDPVDTEALEELLIEALMLEPEDYTEESYGLLMGAVAEAEEVLANEDATQEEVDAALVNLEAAIAGLVAVEPDPDPEPEDPVDTEALEELLGEVLMLDPEDYTEESYTNLIIAMGEALDVLENENTTQEEVDSALANLEAAVQGLEAVEPDPEPQDPPQEPDPEPEPEEPSEEDPVEESETEDPEEDVTIETDEDDEKEESATTGDDDKDNVLPKTSTAHFNWLGGGFIMILLGTAGLLIRKRRTN